MRCGKGLPAEAAGVHAAAAVVLERATAAAPEAGLPAEALGVHEFGPLLDGGLDLLNVVVSLSNKVGGQPPDGPRQVADAAARIGGVAGAANGRKLGECGELDLPLLARQLDGLVVLDELKRLLLDVGELDVDLDGLVFLLAGRGRERDGGEKQRGP